ncbi:MAG: DUF1232 domain-containing protein [Proteobacteria bacterium]|nr:DUF1232 domain-containing protein [Pseudomonadota bacterium]
MNAKPSSSAAQAAARAASGMTFPHGFLDFLTVSQGRRHRVGDYDLDPVRLDRFNRSLHEISREAPSVSMDQIACAGQRALQRHADGSLPSFVQSRMAALARMEQLVRDIGWGCDDDCRHKVEVVDEYHQCADDLIPDDLPVIGLLDDALLADVVLQLLRPELLDYEQFCRFRTMATAYAGRSEADAGMTREHWLEAIRQARQSLSRIDERDGNDALRFGPSAPRHARFRVC